MGKIVENSERDRVRRHYEIERELANRLREASKVERPDLYPEVYAELFRRVEMPGNSEAQRAQVGLLLELVRPFVEGSSSFLEVGAGSCDVSLALATQLNRVWAVDAVDPCFASGGTPPGFSFVAAGEVREQIPPASVDVALSCHFVEHLHPEDLHDHLVDVLDLLKDDGAYLVVTPNRIYGPHDISKGFADRAQGLHLREYTHWDLADELRRAGFADVRVIGKLGTAPRSRGLVGIAVVERLVDGLPARLRRKLVARAPRQEPFRPLEQVKLVAFKGEPHGGQS